MDLINSIIIFGIYQGIVLIAFFINKSSQPKVGQFLFITVLVALLMRLVEFLIMRTGIGYQWPHLIFVSVPVVLLIAPATYLYMRHSLYEENGGSKLKWLIHLIPFISGMIFMQAFFSMQAPDKILYYTGLKEFGIASIHQVAFALILLLQLVIYTILIFRLIRKFKADYQKEQSNTTIENFKWTIGLLAAITLFFSCYTGSYIALFSESVYYRYLDTGAYLILSFMLQFLTIYFLINRFELLERVRISKSKYYSSNLTGMNFKPLISKLKSVMETEELYLNPDLRITDLASLMNVAVPHMSQIINEGTGDTFYDFVNSYRIQRAKQLLLDQDYEKYTIWAIAIDSGFSNKTTFNRTFKKHTGVTPSAYVKLARNDLTLATVSS